MQKLYKHSLQVHYCASVGMVYMEAYRGRGLLALGMYSMSSHNAGLPPAGEAEPEGRGPVVGGR